MMGRSHQIIGFASGVSATSFLYSEPFGVSFVGLSMIGGVAGLLGSLLPDIDHQKSRAGKAMPWLSAIVSCFFEHRGVSHSILAVAGLFYLIYTFAHPDWAWLGWAFLAGYVSHILSDCLTVGGVRVFWPLAGKVRLPLIKSGSKYEPSLARVITAVIFISPYHLEVISMVQAAPWKSLTSLFSNM